MNALITILRALPTRYPLCTRGARGPLTGILYCGLWLNGEEPAFHVFAIDLQYADGPGP